MHDDTLPDDVPPRKRRKGIYILPNLFTLAALFGGFYSVVMAMNARFDLAALGVFAAMILDSLDGRVARMTNTQSAFGEQMDSLSDMVSFGAAPALIAYEWSLKGLGRWGWIAAFVYCACAALRLARFNTRVASGGKGYFEGLPSPSAAAVVASFVWFFSKWREPGLPGLVLAFAVTGYAAALMVSGFSYLSLKQVDVDKRVKYSYIAFVILPMLILIRWDPPTMLFAMFVSYATYGPVQWLVRKLRRPRSAGAA